MMLSDVSIRNNTKINNNKNACLVIKICLILNVVRLVVALRNTRQLLTAGTEHLLFRVLNIFVCLAKQIIDSK
jgi:hypothetical protein